MRAFDRLIVIQRRDEVTEDWEDVFRLHAFINKAKQNDEYLNAGSERSNLSIVFEVRYFRQLELIGLNTQLYRIVYNGTPFDIKDYDDFMFKHKTVKLLGVSY